MQQKYNEIVYEISNKYSFKDFTGHDLSLNTDMDGLVIYSSNFSHETPDSKVFPQNLMGTTFIKCNLSNCEIPDGNLVIDCNQKRFKVQNDLRDWELDESDQPIKVLNEKFWNQKGFSVDPKDIPIEKLKSRTEIKKVGK